MPSRHQNGAASVIAARRPLTLLGANNPAWRFERKCALRTARHLHKDFATFKAQLIGSRVLGLCVFIQKHDNAAIENRTTALAELGLEHLTNLDGNRTGFGGSRHDRKPLARA